MKVAICTPSHGHPSYRYVQSLGALLLHPTGHELRLLLQKFTPVSLNRNKIAQAALDWGADALLWIDDDQTFPPDTLERLLAHRRVIVGCNIAMRGENPPPTAGVFVDGEIQPVYTTEAQAAGNSLQEVHKLGMGVTLIASEVFAKVDQPWFIEALSPQGNYVGSDVYFFERARAKGFKVYVDHALSWEVGHVHERVLFPKDTLAI